MADRHSHGVRTTPRRDRPGAVIRVFGEHVFVAHPAPVSGSRTIGRAEECDIVVSEESVSRVHARLHFGESILIEDAGSSNGTRVGGVELRAGQRARLVPGQVAELGSVLVVIDTGAATGAPSPGIGDHGLDAAALQAQLAAAPAGKPGPGDASDAIIALDDATVVLHRLIDRVASGDISVLLHGETGAGKEVAAERIHRRSARRDRLFLRLNCAALVEPLVESELFGHEKGAFTGAARAKPGLFETAEGGTVFLDEIGEMPLPLQAKLLRVLDERQVLPVGGVKPRPIDVRFIAATNRSLEAEIAAGRFRQDLYFRLSGVVLTVPPLRERPREIRALAEAFAARAAAALGLPPPRLGGEALTALARHPWPGNVRELKNVIERAVLLGQGHEIGIAELGLDRMRGTPAPPEPRLAGDVADAGALHEQIDALERQRILDMLERCGGNQSEAARRLGMSRGTLIARLDRYGAPRPRKSTSTE